MIGEQDTAGYPQRDHHLHPSPPELVPPHFTVDLSLPPRQRYTHIAPTFRAQVATLQSLYDQIICSFLPPSWLGWVQRLSRLLLRRVYDGEETNELHGISQASGVPMHLLVAFNVLLDLFMGCTSGGVEVHDSNLPAGKSKMLHFRALDWGMDPLRKIVMEVDFVHGKGRPVVATSVTYFGYVGMLTAVRNSLSLSLNFRPHHDTSTWRKRWGYPVHLLLVLFGLRRSISSVLRGYVIPPTEGRTKTMDQIVEELRVKRSTAAYLVFSDGAKTVSMEKDNGSAAVQSATEFIVTMNHDLADETDPQASKNTVKEEPITMNATGMADLVEGSLERKVCARAFYDRALRYKNKGQKPLGPIYAEEVVAWMEGPGVVNDETHYAVVMDPQEGKVVWCQRWLEPMEAEKERKKRKYKQARVESMLAKKGYER